MNFNRRGFLNALSALGLAGLLPRGASAQAAQKKTWFIRLIPPRPTFDKDATPAENALMSQHLAYWKDQYAKGVCVFGGPVFDPKGVYGVLVVDADNVEDARALGAGDPSVKAGLNHIEVAEMQAVFLHRAG